MNEVKVRRHQWVEIRVTPIEVVDIDGEPKVVPTGKESQVRVGCFACNMGLSEGFQVECPGQDLFDEAGIGLLDVELDLKLEGGDEDVAEG
jgi:hypothetical protein